MSRSHFGGLVLRITSKSSFVTRSLATSSSIVSRHGSRSGAVRSLNSRVPVRKPPNASQPPTSTPPSRNGYVPNDYFPTPETPPYPPPRTTSEEKKTRRGSFYIILGTLALVGGYMTYQKVVGPIAYPQALPLPGTLEDERLKASIALKGAKLKEQKRFDKDERLTRLSSEEHIPLFLHGFMAGARGIGYQAFFSHKGGQELVGILFLGGGLGSFPRTAHGGAVATTLTEVCDKIAAMNLQQEFPDLSPHLENVQLAYLRPARTEAYHLVTLTLVKDPSKDRLYAVHGELKRLDGQTCTQIIARYRLEPVTKEAGQRSLVDSVSLEKEGQAPAEEQM